MRKNEKVVYCDFPECDHNAPAGEATKWGSITLDIKGDPNLYKGDICPDHLSGIPRGESRKRPGKRPKEVAPAEATA